MVKQELFKKLMSYAKWISSMAIHPGIEDLYFDYFFYFQAYIRFTNLKYQFYNSFNNDGHSKKTYH